MVTMASDLQAQSQDMVGFAAGYMMPDARVFVQNTSTSSVHMAKPNDNRHTLCGWDFGAARKYAPAPPLSFRALPERHTGDVHLQDVSAY